MLAKFFQFVKGRLEVQKISEWIKEYQADIILFIGVVLISLLSFAVGYIVANEQKKRPAKVEQIYENSHYRRGDLRPLSCMEII